MKILLITQYKENIECGTLPQDEILMYHYNTYHLAVYKSLLAKGHNITLSNGNERDIETKIVKSDVVFSIRHDFGYINGDIHIKLLCEKNHINFVGNTSYSKFYDTDKIVGKLLSQKLDIQTPAYFLPYQIKDIPNNKPYILKPRFSASSMNIKDENIFDNVKDLEMKLNSLNDRANYFIEEYINGVTATIGCLLMGEEVVFSDPYYLKSKTHRVITYEDKRSGNLIRDYITNPSTVLRMKSLAKQYFLAIQPCQIARLDFMLTDSEKLYFLEVNSTPNLGCRNKFTSSFVANYFDSYESFIDYLVFSAIDSSK